jgi:hypothetical protein
MASPISAANAYASIAKLGADPSRALTAVPGLAEPKNETGFASLLKDAIGAVQEMGKDQTHRRRRQPTAILTW